MSSTADFHEDVSWNTSQGALFANESMPDTCGAWIKGDDSPSLLMTFLAVILSITSLVGFLANLIVLLSHAFSPLCQAPRHKFVAAMAVMDLLLNLLAKPLSVMRVFEQEWAGLRGVAYLQAGLYWVCGVGSQCQMVLMACNHLVLVTRGVQDMSRMFNRTLNQFLISLSVFVPAALYIVPTSSLPLAECHAYLLSLPSHPAIAELYIRVAAVTRCFLTLTLIAVYGRVIHHLNKCEALCCDGQSAAGIRRIKMIRQTRFSIIRMCCVHALLVLPCSILNLADPFFTFQPLQMVHLLAFHLYLLLSSVNVLLLPLCLPEFRLAIQALMLCQHPAHNQAKVKVGVQVSASSRADFYEDLTTPQQSVEQEMRVLFNRNAKAAEPQEDVIREAD